MNSLRHPLWLFVCVTLPSLVLGGLFYAKFQLIATDLPPDNLFAWHVALGCIAGFVLASVVVAAAFGVLKRLLPLWVGALTSVAGVGALVALVDKIRDLVPFSVPRWVVSDEDLFRFGFTFVMPLIVWGLYQLASARAQGRTNVQSKRALAVEVAGVFGIPGSLFFLFAVASPLISRTPYLPLETLFAFGFVAATTLFAYLLVALVRRLSQRPIRKGGVVDWILRIVVLLVAPIGGLLLNRRIDSIFGDFSHPLWLVFAAVGGIAFAAPQLDRAPWSFAQFALRCALAPFYAYFFLLFLPLLPLSLLAVVLVGFGFMLVSPLVAGVFVTNLLRNQWLSLREGPHRHWVPAIAFTGLLLLPGWMGADAYWKRIQIRTAMEYAFDAPGHPLDPGTLDVERLADALEYMESRWGRSSARMGVRPGEQPYLSEFRDWAIFDNLSMAPPRLAAMKALFGASVDTLALEVDTLEASPSTVPGQGLDAPRWESGVVTLERQVLRPEGPGRTWLDLHLRRPRGRLDSDNRWSGSGSSEYQTRLGLPRDVFVDAYTLDVGDSVHQGVLAERRTATWIYNQITRTNRDPGLLRYLEGSPDLELRVFPFASGESRRTSIRFLHQRPVKFWLGGTRVELVGEDRSRIVEFPGLGLVVPEPVLAGLPRRRPPVKVHFVLDASKAAGFHRDELAASLEAFLRRSGLAGQQVGVVAMNARGTDLAADVEWARTYREGRFEGGFFFERALKHVLSNNFRRESDTVPVVVAVSDRKDFIFLKSDLDRFAPASPGVGEYYRLDRSGRLVAIDLATGRRRQAANLAPPESVGVVKDAKGRTHLVSLHQGSVLVPFVDSAEVPSSQANITPWEHAAAIALKESRLALFARDGDHSWKEILRESFAHGILSRSTAYLAMETRTQENMLRVKQEQVLKGDRNLDVDSESTRMSEPGFWLLLPLAGWVWFSRRRRIGVSRS